MNNTIFVDRFITRERWILGKSPRELETILGYGAGRMSRGAKIYALLELPEIHQFELAGHTHWVNGVPKGNSIELWPPAHVAIDQRGMPSPIDRAKANVRRTWTLSGPDRLVKVVPDIPHSKESVYRPGDGVEQWKLLVKVPAVFVRELGPGDRYLPHPAH